MTEEKKPNGCFCKQHSGLTVRVDHLEERQSETNRLISSIHTRITAFLVSVVLLIGIEVAKWVITGG